ncbi:Polyadenylation and cleavage factor 4 [Glycine max]|nr:Polyadenylation and cleavage factor 4 [Glycine max]
MFSQNVILPPENPRPTAFASKPMSNEIAKPLPSILVGRFKALLKQRDDELRVAAGDPVPPASTDEIVQIYELLLSELTCNLKPIITDLTIIAEQQREHAKGIADAICARILEVPVDQKLPSLYLLDSIVKNFGQEYIRYFSLRLPEVFCEAYRQIQPTLHSAMRHLFGTWSKVFPPSVLRKIETELQFSQAVNTQSSTLNPVRASESSRPSHAIHVNPKYLRQLERSTVDSASKTHQFLSSSSSLGISSSSPSRIGVDRPLSASMDEYAVDNSAQKQYPGDGRNRFPTSVTYSLSNGHQRQSPRALIDAYGSDKSQETSSSKPLLVERLDRNGIDKNTEEEEFDWEDMSPTLRSSTTGFSRERPVVAANATLSGQDARKGWCIRDFHRAPLGQVPRFQNLINDSLGSSQPHDAWKIIHHASNSPQHIFSNRGPARSLMIPPIDNIRNTDINPYQVPPASFEIRPSTNLNVTRPPTLNPITPLQKQQSFDSVENKDANTSVAELASRANFVQLAKSHASTTAAGPTPSQFSQGRSLQPHGASISTARTNPLHVIQFPSPVQSIANNPFIGFGYTILISSLSQGVISLANKLPAQDSVGTEFNPDILKVCHESAVNALYGDLPRQCKTCGLRFRSQEEHSSHMDLHVTKNRMSKSHKQKPSQELGTETVPHFLATETIDYEERKDHEEVAVPAEEDPLKTGVDRSQLGPIIHAKCRSCSNMQYADEEGANADHTKVDQFCAL